MRKKLFFKGCRQCVLNLAFALNLVTIAAPAVAKVEVVDDSQNYAYNEQRYNSAMLVDEINKPTSEPSSASTSDAEKYQLLLTKIEQMQLEIAELRGRLEVQAHQLKLAGLSTTAPVTQSVAEKPVVSAQAHIAETPSAVPKSDVATLSSEPANEPSPEIVRKSEDPMDEQLSYVAAFDHVKHKRFDQALVAMQAFLKAYPEGPYAANAHYWLGELYLQKADYNQAMQQFTIITQRFADSNKIGAALLKTGIIYQKLGDRDKAQAQFVRVSEEFPGTAIARLAKAKIS